MKKLLFIVAALFTVILVNDVSAQFVTNEIELPSEKYEYAKGIGTENIPFANNAFPAETMEKNLRSNRPNVDENEGVGGVLPVGNGMFVMLFFVLFYLFVKRLRLNKKNS